MQICLSFGVNYKYYEWTSVRTHEMEYNREYKIEKVTNRDYETIVWQLN